MIIYKDSEIFLNRFQKEFLLIELMNLETESNVTESNEGRTSIVLLETFNDSERPSTIETRTLRRKISSTVLVSLEHITRDTWTNKVEFLLSVIGYVVDLGKQNTKLTRMTIEM